MDRLILYPMKTSIVFFVFAVVLLFSCNRQTESADSNKGKGEEELNISDFVPCTVCEFEGELVNPLPEDWSELEKELYRVAIDFWEETTGFLFASDMTDLYKTAGPEACQDRFVKVISGELQSNGGMVASEDPIRTYGWRDRFQESAIRQMVVEDPCEVAEPETRLGIAEHMKWLGEVYKCIDIVFHAGTPECLFVERPIVDDSSFSIVGLRLYDSVDGKGVPHLASRFRFYFKRVNGVWHLALRKG
jgi:hypothetical protein